MTVTGALTPQDVSLRVVRAIPDDQEWVLALMKDAGDMLDANPSLAWWRYWHQRGTTEHWEVIRPVGFVHWYQRRGHKWVAHICVDPQARGVGLGRRLMRHVGRPVRLHTREDNHRAIAFYRALGLRPLPPAWARNGQFRLVGFVGV